MHICVCLHTIYPPKKQHNTNGRIYDAPPHAQLVVYHPINEIVRQQAMNENEDMALAACQCLETLNTLVQVDIVHICIYICVCIYTHTHT